MESPTDIFSCARLLQSGLRVSTPPGRCGRRFNSMNPTVLFDENSSPAHYRSPSTYTLVVRQRNLLLEEFTDASSQDSSFSENAFRFLPPSGFAPKKNESPRRCLKFSCESLSTMSVDSGISEDGFSELPQPLDDDSNTYSLPEGLGSLLSASLSTPNRRKRKNSDDTGSAKRARPLSDRASRENRSKGVATAKPKAGKQAKGTLFQYGFTKLPTKPADVKHDCDPDLEIKLALQRSTKEDLIGDFTRPFALPLTPGKHSDLKSITSDTLAKLLNGDYDDTIGSYKIIDCRYPYEYEGGHIKGALNLYTCEDVRKDLLATPDSERGQSGKRNILIFHCEFSSERGPFLSRFLRKEDRKEHSDEYPQLAYPEMYLLHGGYSAFYEDHRELCEPQSYRKMQDPAHTSDLKHFKAKSKSWAPGSHKKLAIRSLSRLGF